MLLITPASTISLLKVSNVMSLQTVPVGLRYKIVAVLKLEGGSPASVYASASTVSAYPIQSYDIMFISVTNHQLKKNWCSDKRSPCPSYLFIADSKVAVTVRVLLGLQSSCNQEDSPPAFISSAIFRFTPLLTLGLRFLWGGYWHLRTRRSESDTKLCTIFEAYSEIAAFVISK